MTPAALRQDLNAAGYTECRNIAIEYHWAETQIDRLQALPRIGPLPSIGHRGGRQPRARSVGSRPAHESGSILAILTYSLQALMSLTSSAFSICELPGNGSLPRLARNFFVSSSTAI